MKKRVIAFVVFCAASALPLLAQGPTFDSSGNGMLSGTYYFRHVLYGVSTEADSSGIAGDISEAIAVFGTITFNGNGTSSINALVSDSSVNEQNGAVSQIPLSCYLAEMICSPTSGTPVAGTYYLSASGFGFMANPITGDQIIGSLSANNVFVGSSTEASEAYNDLFIAALIASPAPGNSFFSGTYTAAGFFPGSSPLSSEDAFFQLTPNGAGSLGEVTVGGYVGTGSTVSQASNGVTYSFTNGAAVVTFPSNQNAAFFPGGAAAPEYFYFSPDGNFFFGGSPTSGYDMIVGVKNASGTQNFSNLYYQAGIDQDDSTLASSGYADFDGYYGSLNAISAGDIFEHQRVSSIFNGVFGSTFADSFAPPITGNYTDTAGYEQYAFGGDGVVRIGEGIWPYMGIQVAVQAPSFSSGPGVYLSPTGIVNSASFSPFTAGVSNGAMVTLFGTGLAPNTVSATTLPLPTSQGLGGVTVQVNGVYAPINYVSPTQILVNVPYEASLACATLSGFSCFAQFVVTNNGVASNPVTLILNGTTPGVFTADYGLGYAYAQHSADYSLVSPSSPAQPGETIIAYVSGLGSVSPIVTDGAAAPGGVQTSNTIAADIGGVPVTVIFAGLVPTLSGLYQINMTLPTTGLTAGDNTLDISGPDSYASQALISIGSGDAAAARKPAAKARPQARSKPAAKRKPFCPTTMVKACQAV